MNRARDWMRQAERDLEHARPGMRSFVQKRSYGSVRVFWLDREGLLRALEGKAAQLLAAFPEVLAVVLFGSLARGEATPRSDA
ncbi:nucleotidyltransferase domain-containing protein, partial [Shewanella sp. C31]|nr:nucleotidyltransferase domain-containing protein [Shewanella electrica]